MELILNAVLGTIIFMFLYYIGFLIFKFLKRENTSTINFNVILKASFFTWVIIKVISELTN